MRLHYGLTEQQLLRYVRIARRAKGPTGQVSLQSPETRSDNIASRLGMAPTVPGARQLVTHKHVLVNDHAVNTPIHRRKPTDVTAVKQPGCRGGAGNSLNRIGEQEDSTPHPRARSAVQLMDRKWIDPNINELLVVEYHPRQAQRIEYVYVLGGAKRYHDESYLSRFSPPNDSPSLIDWVLRPTSASRIHIMLRVTRRSGTRG